MSDTITTAADILAQFRKMRPGQSTTAALFHNTGRAARAAAFRRLSELGLIEVAYLGTGGTKNWRASALALALHDGEELSAVLR